MSLESALAWAGQVCRSTGVVLRTHRHVPSPAAIRRALSRLVASTLVAGSTEESEGWTWPVVGAPRSSELTPGGSQGRQGRALAGLYRGCRLLAYLPLPPSSFFLEARPGLAREWGLSVSLSRRTTWKRP